MAVGADLLTGVVTSIVYDGIKRPTRLLSDAVELQRNTNKALSLRFSDTEDDRQRMKPVISALTRSLGENYSGQMSKFLNEVERSALPDALKQIALCNKDPASALPSFRMMYEMYAPLPVECESIFSALFAAIKTRVDQAVNDTGLMAVVQAQFSEISSKVDEIAACLAAADNISEPISFDAMSEARGRIARGIESANKHINVETTQGTKRVPIGKLVINSRLVQIDEDLGVPLPHRDSMSDDSRSIGYLPFRKTFNRALILGDPGGGKSTLTQLLCHGLASQVSLESATPGHNSFDPSDLRLPLKLILRGLEKRQKTQPSYSVFDYIVDEIKLFLDSDEGFARKFLIQSLTLGQIVLLFDGLDEILDVDARRSMVSRIESFCNAYPTCPALVTSRIVGYADAPLSGDFQNYVLARFNKDEVRSFSQKLLKAISNCKQAEAKSRAETFLSQTEALAEDLRENPLLLGLMVYIFTIRGDVPNNRPEIYKECSLLMFDKWDQRRDIIFKLPQDFDLLDLFGFLAQQIFGSAETEDGVSEEWLLGQIRRFFESWYRDRARAVAAAKELVSFITGRAWVMCEVGPQVYKFTHRTFLEYFFARRIEEESGSVAKLIETQLFPRIINSEWDVVSHLALQIATFRSGPKAIQAHNEIMRLSARTDLSPREEMNFLTFVARALEYLVIPEQMLSDMVGHIGVRAVHLGTIYSLEAIELFHDILISTRRRAGIAHQALREVIAPLASGSDPIKSRFVMYMLGTRYAGQRSSRGRWTPDVGALIWNTFPDIRDGARAKLLSESVVDIDSARTYLYVYRDNYLDLYNKWGLRLLTAPRKSTTPEDICDLLHILLLSASTSVGGVGVFRWSQDSKEDLIRLIEQVAKALESESAINAMREGAIGRYKSYILEEVVREIVQYVGKAGGASKKLSKFATILFCYLRITEFELAIAQSEGVRDGEVERRRSMWPRDLMIDVATRLEGQNYADEIMKWARSLPLDRHMGPGLRVEVRL